jgi:hypothetical protein
MLSAVIVLVFAVSGLVLILLALVVTGIRREAHAELSSQAPSLISAMARRLVGVHVRRPDTEPADSQPDPRPAGHGAEGQ